MVMEVIQIKYHESDVGALSFDTETGLGAFEYASKFIKQGIELSPLKMPLKKNIYTFPELNTDTFRGLPGLIADSLPDDFGNAVLNAWIATQGKSPEQITPLQRLKYTGQRGMGALEYFPVMHPQQIYENPIEVQELVSLAQEILDSREQFSANLPAEGEESRAAMSSLLSVGMSAGGARPKAVLAFNSDFSEVRSGQVSIPEGFTHYLLKFDGVSEHNKNHETFGDPMGFGAMEYVYHLMAKSCGIEMMPCKLLEEGNRRHFLTERFDRVGNHKIHTQTLNGLAHVDYKKPGTFSYAEIFGVARQLKLPAKDAIQLLKRMVFNIIARNHDDHSKNFSFLLKEKTWSLAPAYDLSYSYKPGSPWVNSHWMSLNGKRDHFIRDDFYSLQKLTPLFHRKLIDNIIDETIENVSAWESLARKWDVPAALRDEIAGNLRINI